MKGMKKTLSFVFAAISFAVLLFIVAYIMLRGVPHLKPSLFAMKYTSENYSMMPAIIVTLYVVALSLIVSVPVGVFTAIYMVEYQAQKSIFVRIIRLAQDTLASVPSIVYGLFGYLFFATFMGFKKSILSGFLTVSLMILPTIVRATEEALLSVNNSFRNGSLALGAGRLRTVFKVVLPVAMPGILSGIILSIGRVVGETAALVYTLGTNTKIPDSIMKSGRSLAVHMYMLSGEGMAINEAFATAVVLLVCIIIINAVSNAISKRIGGIKK